MKIIAKNLRKFQEESGMKAREIYEELQIGRSNYYKIREVGCSSIDFVLDFAEKFKYDLINGKFLAENSNCITIGNDQDDIAIVRSALKQDRNFIIYDRNYLLLNEFGSWLESRGYEIKILNLCDLDKSNTFNPLSYLQNESDIYAYSEFLIKSMLGKDSLGVGEYELCIGLNALLLFLIKNCPEHMRNLHSVVKLLQAGNINNEKSKPDRIFDKAETDNLNPVALSEFKIFSRKSATDLMKLLHELNIVEVQNLTNTNNIRFEDIFSSGGKKVAIFCISNPSRQFDWIIESLTYQIAKRMPEQIKNSEISILCPSKRIEKIYNHSIMSSPSNYQIKQSVPNTAR